MHQRSLTFSFRSIRSDSVEDVDEDQKESDKERHPARDDIRRNNEADPGDDHEKTRGKVVGDQVVGDVAVEDHLEASHTEVPKLTIFKENVFFTQLGK